MFSFSSCYRPPPVATGGHKLTVFSFSSCYRSLPVATGGHKLTVFSFSSCYRSLPVATGGHKLTVFSFSSCYRSLPVATGGTQVDDVCFDSCYKSLPVAVVAFVFLSATGRYRSLQVDTSCCFCLSFFSFFCCFLLYVTTSVHANSCFVFIDLLLFQGIPPHEPILITNNYIG